MPIMAPLPVGSSPHPHDVSRRLGPLTNTSLASSTQATPTHEDNGGDGNEVMIYTLDDADDEDQDHIDTLDDEEGEEGEQEEDDNEEADDEEDEEDEEGLYDPAHHNCPIHHQQSLIHESLYHQDPDTYLSDDEVMSDDAGAPLADHVATQHPADNMDVDVFTDVEFPWHDDDGSNPEFDIMAPNPDMVADAQAVAMEVHTQAAAILNTAPFVGVTWEQFPPGATWTHAFSVPNPNPATIGPSNYGLADFLHHWARHSRTFPGMARGGCPWPASVNALQSSGDELIEYDDLEGDRCDFQGVDWEDIGVARRDARERRFLTYSNYVNIPGSDAWTPNLPDAVLPRNESFFRFRRMDIKRNIHLSHFQLRNVFASTSRSRVFYPALGTIQQFNPMSGHGRAIMELSDAPASQVSTLAAGQGVLVAGGFSGEYMLRHLDSCEPESTACHEGVITSSISGITNHVAVHQARISFAPRADFASNDNCFRVLDLTTETWVSEETHDFAPNCAALSPDGRLRVMVGDSLDVIITAAESSRPKGEPDVLQRLSGHRDYGFACDWADDGWTIATAFQDKTVKIWDARRFTDSAGNAAPVCTIRSEMAGARSVRFSPIGSGKRVLVAVEEADFINIIDAQTFRSKQTVDVFGELGGISFENGGQDLMVLCCDRSRGGILQLERCDQGRDPTWNSDGELVTDDWPRSIFTKNRHMNRSRRRTAAYADMDPF
ncbi:WD40-repeat-containing domain protein [Chaetomium tenue]|uniref:WD40-repeat-containing domain protein n=1 Tax=Chaetomium tenue TaxID=1854479 RepID=A0ACB7PRH1_9PEZI|nr:WD40-repeat-containing domain protein [Chaetomium globosum]